VLFSDATTTKEKAARVVDVDLVSNMTMTKERIHLGVLVPFAQLLTCVAWNNPASDRACEANAP